jgi:hypothetical protein
MSQWDRRAANKSLEELETWAELLSLDINDHPVVSANLIVKRRWILEIIEGRRNETITA